jgi:two-component system phosphate regulon sensor histidine kinase PhoR
MIWRVIGFVGLQFVGGLFGWLALSDHSSEVAMMGALAAGLAWFVADTYRGARLLQWVRTGDVAQTAPASGLWGETAERVRRLVRVRERMTSESQDRLNDFLGALQASPNGVTLLDVQGRIEWFNHTASQHFGLDARRDMQQYFGNLVRDPGFAAYLAGRDYSHELAVPGRASTALRPVNLSIQLHLYGEGRLLLLSRDVTAVQQAEAMRRDFVANVSHEIRTPLTVLSGFVETLQTLTLTEPERERYLGTMALQAQRMQTLVNDLLMLSRLEGSPPPGLADWVSMPNLMAELEREGRDLSAVLSAKVSRVVTLVFEVQCQCELSGSASELLSAASNLVSNAIRYTPPSGEVHVSLSPLPDGSVEFSVRDTGPGIAPEHIPRLTERFYRIDRSRSRDTGGTGLGLAIVKHVAQRHGAELAIASTPGHGSKFSIIFPLERVRQIG